MSIFSSLLDKLEHMDTQTGLDIDSTISKLQSKIFGAYLVMNSWSVCERLATRVGHYNWPIGLANSVATMVGHMG